MFKNEIDIHDMTLDKMPLVSVVIPTYNRANFVIEAIQSALKQSYKKIEVIIVDDGSTDRTKYLIQNIKDPRVKYVYQSNKGVSSARNKGIEIASGRYVTFLDSDDLYSEDCIEKKVAIAESSEDIVLVGGGCTFFEVETCQTLRATPARKQICYEDLCVFTAFPGGTNNIFARKKAIESAGFFNQYLSASEDRDFLRRLSKQGAISSVPGYTVTVRVHAEDRPNRNFDKIFIDREWVSQQIPERRLRKKSRAWTHMLMGTQLWQNGRKLKALYFWGKSFVIFPMKIHDEKERIKPIFRDYILQKNIR